MYHIFCISYVLIVVCFTSLMRPDRCLEKSVRWLTRPFCLRWNLTIAPMQGLKSLTGFAGSWTM